METAAPEEQSVAEQQQPVAEIKSNNVEPAAVEKTSAVPPKSLETVKQMFDSATLMKMENQNPFKGSKDLNRTSNNRFVAMRSNGPAH